ncbi:MAG: hypothetical protein ACRD5H_01095 [Nitrososphaerales archaeon]
MQSNTRTTILSFQGGFATDLAAQTRDLSFLVKAENLIYEVSGAVHKVGGTERINATALTGSPTVNGFYDFWLSGTGGTSTQLGVAVTSDSKIYSIASDGTATDRTGAAVWTVDTMPVFAQARDRLTIWSTAGDTPLSYNQTGNVSTFSASAPLAKTAAFHINRLWAANTNANPSRLFYSSSTDVTDWSGADTGTIDVDPEDGDRIIGIVSHQKRLIVFKGPHKGSIHIIEGSAPTGSDAFVRRPSIRGLALQSPNAIVNVSDDIWFMSSLGIHSFETTQRFGDFKEATLTRFLHGYFRDEINKNRMNRVWATNYSEKGCVLFTLSSIGSTANNTAFGLSYTRLPENEGEKAFIWTRSCQCAAIRINPTTNIRDLVFGDNMGFLNRQDIATRTLAGGTAYAFRVLTPSLVLGAQDRPGLVRADQPVVLKRMYLRTRPTGNYNITVAITRDTNASESYTFNQGSAGFILDVDLLGTGTLGGGNLQVAVADLVGVCRSCSLDITQAGASQDADLYEIGIDWEPISLTSQATDL